MAQHPVDLSTARIVVADADAQAGEVLADELDDMSEAIVSSVASTAFQPELAERQRYVVADDEEARLVNLLR